MFVAFITLFLRLVLVSQSAPPPPCEELLRPFNHTLPQDLEGEWVLVAAGLNSTSDMERFKRRDSATLNFVSTNGTDMFFTRVFGFNDTCQYFQSAITVGGSGFFFSHYNITVIFMHTTCPDCLVMHFDSKAKTPVPLYLFSKRREVEHAEMEEFKAQVECLKKSCVVIMDPTKVLCSEPSTGTTLAPAKRAEGKIV